MKTASFPALRVEPQLRRDAQRVLGKGETLSAFVEGAIRRSIDDREAQAEFIRRGLASAASARDSGDYVPASMVLKKLARRLAKARRGH